MISQWIIFQRVDVFSEKEHRKFRYFGRRHTRIYGKKSICGDRGSLDSDCGRQKIIDLKHHTKGCLLCKAGAALLFEQVHSGSRKTAEVQVDLSLFNTDRAVENR